MGMFDDIYVDSNELPLTDEQKKIVNYNDGAYQTKSFENLLDQLFIKDGILYFKSNDDFIPYRYRNTKEFYFYNSLPNKGWVEFKGYLDGSNVTKIELIEFDYKS